MKNILTRFRLVARSASLALLGASIVASTASAATLLHYNFGDGSGTAVTDLSGSNNHGTLVGFASTSAGAGVFAASEGWVPGGGLSTLEDGVASFVDTPLALNALGLGPFTLEYTASFTAPDQGTAGTANAFAPAISGSAPFDNFANLFVIGRRDNIGLESRLPGDGASSVPGTGLQPWNAGTASDVHHIAVTYTPTFPSGGDVRIYTDGVLTSTPDFVSPGPVNLPTANVAGAAGNFRFLGSAAGPQEWDGVMHGVAISNVVLGPGSFVIPEPTSLALIGVGLVGLMAQRRVRMSL